MRKKSNYKTPRNMSIIISLIRLLAYALVSIIAGILQLLFILIGYLIFRKSGYKEKTNISFIKAYWNKGYRGEYIVYRKICRLFTKENVFLNVYLTKEDNTTTEIDIMAISPKGIYLFEVKNYGGYIFGTEEDKMWTQVLNYRTKNKFYNPILQNESHVRVASTALEVEQNMFKNIVVFTTRSVIKTEVPNNVVKSNALIRYLNKISRQGNVLSDNDIRLLKGKIAPNSCVSSDVKDKHIEQITAKTQVKNDVKEYLKKENLNKCPKCGSELKLRTVKTGEKVGNNFYGCSNYPKCKYTKNI